MRSQEEMELDAQEIVKVVEERLAKGRSSYGDLNVMALDRDWPQEALEEAIDLSVYLATMLIRGQRLEAEEDGESLEQMRLSAIGEKMLRAYRAVQGAHAIAETAVQRDAMTAVAKLIIIALSEVKAGLVGDGWQRVINDTSPPLLDEHLEPTHEHFTEHQEEEDAVSQEAS